MRRLTLLITLLSLAALGCEDALPRASEILHMRILGATTSVVGDPERTTPKPGETAHLDWTVVFPDLSKDNSEVASMFVECTAPTRFTGTPVCQELLDAAQSGAGIPNGGLPETSTLPDCQRDPNHRYDLAPLTVTCVTGTPKVDLTIAKDVKTPARLVRGIVCRNAVPMFDLSSPTGFQCDPLKGVKKSQVESIPVYGTVTIQHDAQDENRNPNIDATSFLFHDPPLAWKPLTPEEDAVLDDDNCRDEATAGRATHSEGKEESIHLRYDGSARELFDGEPEPLEFSAYVTLGKLSRRFTVFRSDAREPLESEFHWELTADQRHALNGKSKRIRFYFTLLDHRGGFAVVTRDVCVNR